LYNYFISIVSQVIKNRNTETSNFKKLLYFNLTLKGMHTKITLYIHLYMYRYILLNDNRIEFYLIISDLY
jgi:hypothetical protein